MNPSSEKIKNLMDKVGQDGLTATITILTHHKFKVSLFCSL